MRLWKLKMRSTARKSVVPIIILLSMALSAEAQISSVSGQVTSLNASDEDATIVLDTNTSCEGNVVYFAMDNPNFAQMQQAVQDSISQSLEIEIDILKCIGTLAEAQAISISD